MEEQPEPFQNNLHRASALRDLLLQTQISGRSRRCRRRRRHRGGCALLSVFYDDVETITLCARCKLEASHPIKLMAGSAQKPLTPGSSIFQQILYKMDLFRGLFLKMRARLPSPASRVVRVDCEERSGCRND